MRRWQLGLVVGGVLVLIVGGAAYLSTVIRYDPVSLIVGLGALATVVGLIYRVAVEGQAGGASHSPNEDTGAGAAADADNPAGETRSDDPRIGATSGLTPEQKQLQNELLKVAFDEFADEPFAFMVTYQAPHLIDEVADRSDADEDAVRTVWKFCRDDGFFRKRGNSWRMTPKAVFRAEELGLDVGLDDGVQEELLDALLQSYRDDPHRPKVGEGTLLEAVGQSQDGVLLNLWFLCEKGYVERESYVGGRAEYQITDRGRRYME